MTEEPLFTTERRRFHAALLQGILTLSAQGIPSNADKDSRLSRDLATAILEAIGGARTETKGAGQTAGRNFEAICAGFLQRTFLALAHIRPGSFTVAQGGAIARFDQYAHLATLDAIAREHRDVAMALGSDYLIKPDIVISRAPLGEAVLNAERLLVDRSLGLLSSLRAKNNPLPTLHASISCKWTLRSDRAQNARSEGLNLMRNRKGRMPHVAVITAEPMPSRIASLALGTGDIDCVYHFALDELAEAVATLGSPETRDILDAMIEGRRLRDIVDLPLDLAI